MSTAVAPSVRGCAGQVGKGEEEGREKRNHEGGGMDKKRKRPHGLKVAGEMQSGVLAKSKNVNFARKTL